MKKKIIFKIFSYFYKKAAVFVLFLCLYGNLICHLFDIFCEIKFQCQCHTMSSSHSSRKKSSISEVLNAKKSDLEHSSYRNISFPPNKSLKKIKPVLKSQNAIGSIPKNCSIPCFFTTFFGATVDETVIAGILTFLDYLSSFTCGHEFIEEPSLVKVPSLPHVPVPAFSEKIKAVESLPVEAVPVASVPKVTIFVC